jgi:hypothetical protein
MFSLTRAQDTVSEQSFTPVPVPNDDEEGAVTNNEKEDSPLPAPLPETISELLRLHQVPPIPSALVALASACKIPIVVIKGSEEETLIENALKGTPSPSDAVEAKFWTPVIIPIDSKHQIHIEPKQILHPEAAATCEYDQGWDLCPLPLISTQPPESGAENNYESLMHM